MGSCGCGKTKGTLERPLVAGQPNGAEAVELKLLINYGGVPAGQTYWVTGDGIALWIERGYAMSV